MTSRETLAEAIYRLLKSPEAVSDEDVCTLVGSMVDEFLTEQEMLFIEGPNGRRYMVNVAITLVDVTDEEE